MKIADLYIRVSTDEQADYGYSQRNQEDLLRKYCLANNIEIRKVIYEDHSAKTFERPEWKKELLDLKKKKGLIDLILFVKWDRFSRNAGDAYRMIGILRKLGVEPQSIEQPLDMEVPESKLMLAIYLAAPEVENDRRSLNVFHGMRRAKKEGRFMGPAPLGYLNRCSEDGKKKYIVIQKQEAVYVKWIYEEIARGQMNAEKVWKTAIANGLKCSKHNFWIVIRNPLYCGKIIVKKFKDEDLKYVRGQHEPIISEELFETVQDVLDGRGRYYRPKTATNEDFPLRGHILCPKCGKPLTASKSKGRTQYYSYYHCGKECQVRFKAEDTHNLFVRELRKYVPRPGMLETYREILSAEFKVYTRSSRDERSIVLKQIDQHNERINKARREMLFERIDPEDFRILKGEVEKEISRLERTLKPEVIDLKTIDGLIAKGINNLANLDKAYEKASFEEKRSIVGSIFPEKLTFTGFAFRTTRLNEIVKCIYQLENELSEKKDGTSDEKIDLCRKAVLKEFEPYFMRGGDMAMDFLAGAMIPELSAMQEKAEKAHPERPKGYEVGYRTFTINGRQLGHGEPIRVKYGERVLFHILNGSASEIRSLALPGHTFKVVALDGNPVPQQAEVPLLWLGTAERISAVVEMKHPGVWIMGDLADDDRGNGMGIVVEYAGHNGKPLWVTPKPYIWDYRVFSHNTQPAAQPDEVIDMLFAKDQAADNGFNRWSINGMAFDMMNMGPMFHLQKGKRYRLHMRNASDDIHPMHLHRHSFELTRVNGKPTSGIIKDVAMLGGFQEMDVDFVADNPGMTLFHCHMQLHMDFGFMALFDYAG